MIYRIGKSVKINDIPLSNEFHADLIDHYKFRSPVSNKIEDCEHWGWNDEGFEGNPYYDFAMIGKDFHVNIYRGKTEFFTPECLVIYSRNYRPSRLFLKSSRDEKYDKIPPISSHFSPVLMIPKVPETVLEFGLMLNTYIVYVEYKFIEAQMDYFIRKRINDYEEFLRRKAQKESGVEEDLPF